jgi:23S rRNA pseudouridine2605 synthase
VRGHGQVATLGDEIRVGVDTVLYRGKPVLPRADKPHVYLLLNKPRGIVCTAKDEKGRRNVTDLVSSVGVRVYPVGRLDMDSEGLLLLTDDGELTNRLTHPRHEIPKIYRVWVSPAPTAKQLEQLNSPMEIDGYRLLPVKTEQIDGAELEMTLYEGRNRQIRKMCEQLGLTVTSLRRIAIGAITLGNLKSGTWKRLTRAQVDYLKNYK